MKNRASLFFLVLLSAISQAQTSVRERISFNADWRFEMDDPAGYSTSLVYDDLKPWILPSGNDFISNPAERYIRPAGNPGNDCPYVQSGFDDASWEQVTLPHDWAIAGPFMEGWGAEVGGSMGRLPSPGIGWYRKKFDVPTSDAGKMIFLDVDGSMAYATVWINGNLAGGWPFGYASWRVDLTPYVVTGGENQLAIRLENLPDSSRWYPGGGIYRNVWLVKTEPIHVAQWGTYITTSNVSASSATIDLEVTIDNDSQAAATVEVDNEIFVLGTDGQKVGSAVTSFGPQTKTVSAGSSAKVNGSVTLADPLLWGPPPTQTPHRYVVVTSVSYQGQSIDSYETPFGIRSITYNSNSGVYVNGEHIYLNGVNQHHDLGALGAAFNTRAAERQIEILQEMGCNAIRTAHNPPAPEFLELADRMGVLVMDEIFDCWESAKVTNDFHLIFPDWHEQDLRAFVHRDRNHPSVIMWSFGNEVPEQWGGSAGASIGQELYDIANQEDAIRPSTCAMNVSGAGDPLPNVPDVIGLNYQGEGIRWYPPYDTIDGTEKAPQYSNFHTTYPNKVILSTENASAFSTRGTYFFPVTSYNSAPIFVGTGYPQDYKAIETGGKYVSAYELYTADCGASADRVFATQDQNPFVAGGFCWTGWDYLGEPPPDYLSRSSYFGIIDLAGFKKDRFYIYQAHWQPDLPMVHILPHWTWPERVGLVTPVHVFTSGDEVELFLNDVSLGTKTKGQYEYRLRWDNVVYQSGELKAVAYKNGQPWAEETIVTAGDPAKIELTADRTVLQNDGEDLIFVTARIIDNNGVTAPRANDWINFTVNGPGEIVATDNGDPSDMTEFPSPSRNAFNGLCLAIIRGKPGNPGTIEVVAQSSSLASASIEVTSVGEYIPTPLKVDFGNSATNNVQNGYEVYYASHEQPAAFATQTYGAFASNISITPTWAAGAEATAMQMLDRGTQPYEDATENLMRDWIGTDTRSVGDPLTLTIGGLPAGNYTWTSYHHDTAASNMGIFDVMVNDAAGSATTTDVQITGNAVTTFDNVATFSTTLVSNGVDDVTLVFDQQPYSFEYNQAWFVMNGFEIEYLLEIPDAPTGLNATSSAGQIDLTWDAPGGATSYNVKRSTDDGGYYTTIASPMGTSYSDTGLPELTTYYYVVSGVNSVGESADSTQASATTPDLVPSAPTGLTAIASDASVTLDWDANSEVDLAGYNVYRSTTSKSGYTLQNGSLLISPTFTDTNVTNYTTYYYIVTVVDTGANESTYSEEISAMPNDGSIVQLSVADFESGLGDWVNITGEDTADWLLKSGSTLTSETGPDGGANGSTWYAYLETSPSGDGRIAILESPVIQGYKRTLSFYYHMYGAEMGTLNVDVNDGTWYDAVWSLSGQQHTSESDEYTLTTVDLTDYAGPIQIRFRGVGVTGSHGDMAIDDIEVTGGLLYGDMNGDSIVNTGDLSQYMGSWLQGDCDLDLDGDCVITLYEFSEFGRNWLNNSYQ